MRRVTAAALLAAGLLAGGTPAVASAADDWALEFVSPLQSVGRNVEIAWGWADGEHAYYYDNVITADVVLPQRTAGGWEGSRRLRQQGNDVVPGVTDANADMSRVIVTDETAVGLGDQTYDEGIYLHEGGTVTPIAQWQFSYSGPSGKSAYYLGADAERRTLYVFARDGVLDAPPTPTSLYRWRDGVVEPVVIDDARYAACPARAATAGATISAQDHPQSLQRALLQNGVSADGRTVVVATRSCSAGGTQYPAHLYLIRDGVATDISRPVTGEPDAASNFAGMTPDASRIFLTTAGRLTADDANTRLDLYMWSGGALTRITGDAAVGGRDLTSAVVSPDGSTVWFTTRSASSPFVYDVFAWRDGAVSHVTTPGAMVQFNGAADYDPTQTTYDGSALVLATNQRAFGVDPRSRRQLYRITLDGAVACVSCAPDGTAVAEATTTREWMAGKASWADPRISRDGSTIAFQTAGGLLPQDTNGVHDVYVWRDGALALVSSGSDPADADAVGMSWDGRTVYFKSWGAIVPGTTDLYRKLYAARVGGGFPLPQPPQSCGADCQGPLPPVPFVPVPASSSYQGHGNLPEAPFLSLQSIGSAAQKRMAKRGRVTVVAESNVAATVRAGLRARLGKRWVRADRGSRRLAEAGTARITLRLSKNARRTLARKGALRVQVTVASSETSSLRRASFVLRKAMSRGGSNG